MNKTVNINIGGLFFHIDEDAYQKLAKYFDAIKRSLSNSSGKEEIMKDIEMRVAELLSDRQKSDKHVVNNKDVEEVISIMGQPEDYRIDNDENENNSTQSNFAYTGRKKLYRDKDRGLIGGVCTGLGHYFGVDSVWIKIAFLVLFFGFGTGLVAYIILWIAMPKAITTAEKLEMTGEPVNISNIEKKVREEFDSMGNRINNTDFNHIKSGAERVANGLGDAIMKVFKILAKVLGALILITSALTLGGLLIGLLTLGTTSFIDTPWEPYLNAVNYTDVPLWIFSLLTFFLIGIPSFFFLLLGLKLLVNNMKPVNTPFKYSLLAVWIFSLGALIVIGVKQSTETAFEGKTVLKETINLLAKDTLKIRFVNNDFYNKNSWTNEDFIFTQDSLKNEVIYSNNIRFEIKETEKTQPYVQIELKAKGKSFREANDRAEKIKYNFKINGNQLLLDNYFLADIKSKYRNQSVSIYLYLPKGTLFKTDESVEDFDYSDNQYFNLHYSSDDYIYQVTEDKVKCLNCPPEENDYNDADIETITTEEINGEKNDTVKTVSVKINGKEVIQTKEVKKGRLITAEDGTIIKTK